MTHHVSSKTTCVDECTKPECCQVRDETVLGVLEKNSKLKRMVCTAVGGWVPQPTRTRLQRSTNHFVKAFFGGEMLLPLALGSPNVVCFRFVDQKVDCGRSWRLQRKATQLGRSAIRPKTLCDERVPSMEVPKMPV